MTCMSQDTHTCSGKDRARPRDNHGNKISCTHKPGHPPHTGIESAKPLTLIFEFFRLYEESSFDIANMLSPDTCPRLNPPCSNRGQVIHSADQADQPSPLGRTRGTLYNCEVETRGAEPEEAS